MADASFDVVIIGGGQQGLVIGNYLAHNGMTVGIFEQRQELGGAACSDPRPVAGFIGNPHADHAMFMAVPAYYDFNLREKGLDFVFSEVRQAYVFPDERCLLLYKAMEWNKETGEFVPNQEMIDRNIKEVEKFSPRDAQALTRLVPSFYKWQLAFGTMLFNPPPLPGEFDPMEDLFNDPVTGVPPRYRFMTLMEIVNDLFDSAELKTSIFKLAMIAGQYPDEVPALDLALAAISGFTGVGLIGLPQGGAHNIAHALQRAFSEQGGRFFVGADVDQVLIENDRARGIKLADGTEIEAKELVIDTAEIKQTINRHLGEAPISSDIRRKIDNLRTDRCQVLWGTIGFHELPQYKAASWNPDLNKARWIFMGDADVEYFCREYRYRMQHLRPGQWPEKLYPSEANYSKWDPSYAPPGKHGTLWAEGCAPPASWLSEREWLQLKKEAADQYLREWQRYAPNMTQENVIGIHIGTPYDHQQENANWVDGCWATLSFTPAQSYKFRPLPELAQYQIPGIENFYMASGSSHAGGIATAGFAGYGCYKRIAQKLDLWKPWEGRLY